MPVRVQTPLVNVSLAKQSSDELFDEFAGSNTSSTGVVFTPGSLHSVAGMSATVAVVVKTWSRNPFVWAANGSSDASVISVELSDGNSSDALSVTGAAVPVMVALQAPINSELESFKCGYWDPVQLVWTGAGTVLVAIEVDPLSASTAVVHCGSLHLTDFSGSQGLSFLNVRLPNPLRDYGLLGQAFTGTSLYTTILTLCVLGGCFLSWAVSGAVDERKAKELQKLRKAHFLLYGEVTSGLGMDALHEGAADRNRAKLLALRDKLVVSVSSSHWACSGSFVGIGA